MEKEFAVTLSAPQKKKVSARLGSKFQLFKMNKKRYFVRTAAKLMLAAPRNAGRKRTLLKLMPTNGRR